MMFDDTNVEKHLHSVRNFLEAFHISDVDTQHKIQEEFMKIDFPYLEKAQAAVILERFQNRVQPLLEEADSEEGKEDEDESTPANLLGDTKEGEVLSFRVNLSTLNKTVKDLKAQLGDVEAANAIQKGMEREASQSDDENIQFVLALNNLAANPKFYDNLATFETGESPKIATLKDTTLKDADPAVAADSGEVSIDTSAASEDLTNEEPTAGESLGAEDVDAEGTPSEDGIESAPEGEETPEDSENSGEDPESSEDEDEDKKKDGDFDIDEFLASVDSEA